MDFPVCGVFRVARAQGMTRIIVVVCAVAVCVERIKIVLLFSRVDETQMRDDQKYGANDKK